MTVRIAHLSDIHFGGENTGAVEAAIGAVHAFAPALTMVTGDLTLNGLPREFRAAAHWIERLPPARLVTPGNHDTPYWNLALRALTPFRRYRRYIGPDVLAGFDAPGVTARCLNSARGAQPRLNWAQGAISTDRLGRMDWGGQVDGVAALKVFGCHHPLVDIDGAPVTGGVHRGAEAARLLAAVGVELVLTGHVHVPFVLPLPPGAGICYSVGAGTLSVRTRGAPAGFSTILADDHAFKVTALSWTGRGFEPTRSWTLPRRRFSGFESGGYAETGR